MFRKRLLPAFIALAASGSLSVHAQTEGGAVAAEDEIIVTGVRNAELNARQSERDKNIFSSVISQDDAGDFADQNVAESLQRLPGITLQKTEGEGRFVTVRGLGPGFVTVQQNGSELASAGSDDRAFALDSIPADLLGSIEVFKSLTPDMDLNSIGGAVNVNTVSAFDRKKDSMRVSVQGSYQENSEEFSPKVSIQGTNLFADDTVGVGYSLSWEKRNTETYEVLHHETTDMRFIQQDHANSDPEQSDPWMLIPHEFQNRQETAERTRVGGSLDLGFRPTENSEYTLRGSYTELEDLDLAWREYYRFGQAGVNDIPYVDPASGIFGIVDADIQQQMFIQEGTSSTKALSAEGKNIFPMSSGDLTLDYKYAWSEGKYEKPDGKRVQFRVRDVPLIGQAGKEFVVGEAISATDLVGLAGLTLADLPSGTTTGYTNSGVSVSSFNYDNLFLENSDRLDDLSQISANLKKDFHEGFVSYIKAGFTVKNRDRERNQDRWSLTPESFDVSCNDSADPDLCRSWIRGDLSDFENEMINDPSFSYPAITQSAAKELIAVTRVIAAPNEQQGLESVFRDYSLVEDTAAAYVMGEFRLSDNQTLITGVRWEETKFSSTGFLAINNDNFDFGDGSTASFDYSIPLEGAESKYDDLYPSIHYRFEPREDVLVRASVWTSFTRPSFDQARAFATINSGFELCNPATNICDVSPQDTLNDPDNDPTPTPEELESFTLGANSTLNFGNPGLVAMNSTNLDASIGWYASEDLFIQAAIFYKDIDDFIVDVSGSTMALNDLPIDLPVDQVDAFTIPSDLVLNNVNWTTNGDKAKVYGIELSYSQYFESGLFIQSNATLMNSTADVGETIRADEIQLPDQADTTINLTVGWENDEVSLRLINNYRSKVLDRIGSCPAGSEGYVIAVAGDDRPTCKEWADIYHDATYSMDFKATYQITDELKIYFDALNLTEEYSVYYYEGNEYSRGNSLYHSEVYGRSFQFGLNYKFM
jgi:TonB-dependent receptor